MSEKRHIEITKTATYYVLGNIKTAKSIWFVLHGYGYAAEFFIKKFECISNDDVAIIAPEGLSRFYKEGVYGRVGASWMTKVDRELEIYDYINYLNDLYNTIRTENSSVKINVVGFSQGGATASRWIAANQVKINNFILWSSIFPEDMNFTSFGQGYNCYLIYGNNDQFGKPEDFTKQRQLLQEKGVDVEMIEFEGPHDIPKEVLLEMTNKLELI